MKRVLMLAGAALIYSGPVWAADVTTEKSTTTITREVVPAAPRDESTTITREVVPAEPRSGSTVATEILAPEPPPPPRVEARPEPPRPGMVWQDGHWEWNPRTKTY